MHDMLRSADFSNVARIKELLTQHYSGLESSLVSSPLRYALNLSTSGLSGPLHISKQWYGLDYFWAIRDLMQDFESKASELIEKFQSFQHSVLGLEGAHLILSCDSDSYKTLTSQDFYGLHDLEVRTSKPWKPSYTPPAVASQARIIASPVAFTAASFASVAYNHPAAPHLSIASNIFANKVLHKRIREQGGAYGGRASDNPTAATFSFYAYRDPNLASTLDAFHEAVDIVVKGDFDAQTLESAKLEVVQDLDNPVSPGSRAMTAYSWQRTGRTQEVRQQFRDRLLSATKEDVQNATKEFLAPGLDNASVVTFAGRELLDREVPNLRIKPFPIEPV